MSLVDKISQGFTRTGILIKDISNLLIQIKTLSEVNALKIDTKTDIVDFEALSEEVVNQGINLNTKVSQSTVDTLQNLVNTKATIADINSAIALLVDGAPDSLNTLSEIALALQGDEASINTILESISKRVRFDEAQSLTVTQQVQVRDNINAEAKGVAANLVSNVTVASIGAATAAQGAKANTALQSADVAPVAFTGSYNDLINLPIISDTQEIYVQSNQPISTGRPYMWIQTGLPGQGVTLWVDNGE